MNEPTIPSLWKYRFILPDGSRTEWRYQEIPFPVPPDPEKVEVVRMYDEHQLRYGVIL